ncbi:hypothetical protein EBR21_05835 [bacterium]|nr:hypothetical protein [bacterium]
MNQIPDWKNVPSGSNPERPAAQKRSAGLLFSGILIAISLLAFVLPLAAYHAAQVASVLRVRSAVLLMLVVSFVLYALGVTGQLPVFAMAGVTGVLCTPLLALVLTFRSRDASVWWALVVLSLPIAFFLMALLQVPQGFNLENWITEEFARIPDRPGLDKQQLLTQLKSAQALQPLQKLFNLSDWQRIAWFLFSEGGALSISILGSLFGTLALIDFAFAQAERIRGVINYVVLKTSEFPQQMVSILAQTQESLSGIAAAVSVRYQGTARLAAVQSHAKKTSRAVRPGSSPAWTQFLAKVLRDPPPPGTTEVMGYQFRFAHLPGWNFRALAVPLWLSAPSLALLVYLASLWKGDEAIDSWLPAAPLGAVLVWGAFAALCVLTALALQGALVIHSRLRPLAGLFLIFLVLVLVSSSQGGAVTLLALLAGLGLLDGAYDFRKRLAKTQNAV